MANSGSGTAMYRTVLLELPLPALTGLSLAELAAFGRVACGAEKRVRVELARRDVASRYLRIWAGHSGWSRILERMPGLSWTPHQWNVLPPMPEGRVGAICAVLRGALYVCGGSRRGVVTNAADRLRLAKGSWEALPPLSDRRRVDNEASAAVLNGQLYIVGGTDFSELHASSCADRFDPVQNQWEVLPCMPERRRGAAAAALEGRLFVYGGCAQGPGSEVVATNSVLSFQPQVGTWEELTPMLERRHKPQAVVANGTVYIGQRDRWAATSVPFPLALGERFNVLTQRWSRCAPGLLCNPGSNASAVLHGCMYVWHPQRSGRTSQCGLVARVVCSESLDEAGAPPERARRVLRMNGTV